MSLWTLNRLEKGPEAPRDLATPQTGITWKRSPPLASNGARRAAGLALAVPCVAAALLAFLAPEGFRVLADSHSAALLFVTIPVALAGFACWPTAFLRRAVSRERIEGFRFVRRELVIPPRRKDEAYASIQIDGETVGDTRGAQVMVVTGERARTAGGRMGLIIRKDHVVLLKRNRAVFEVWRTGVDWFARGLADDLAGAIGGSGGRVDAERIDEVAWADKLLPAAFSGLLTVAGLFLWLFVGHWPPRPLRLLALVLVLLARFSELPLRLSASPATNAAAFGKVYGKAEPARPTEWLTPAAGARIYWVSHAMLAAVLIAGAFVH